MSDDDHPVLSARNPRLVELRRLSGRRGARTDTGRFVIDGPKLIAEAIAAGVLVHDAYVRADAVESVGALLAALDGARVRVALVPGASFASLSSTESPQPVLAVAECPRPDISSVLGHDALLVLVDVADPGNAGTLVRVGEAAGIGGVIACGAAVDWWNPKVVRASAGSLFRVPVAVAADAREVLEQLHQRGCATVATALGAPEHYTAVDYRGPTAIVLGGESRGLSPHVLGAATRVVSIPMLGAVESLNVAMAGAVCAFEMARQRRTGG